MKPIPESDLAVEEDFNAAEEVITVTMDLLTVVSAVAVVWLVFVVT